MIRLHARGKPRTVNDSKGTEERARFIANRSLKGLMRGSNSRDRTPVGRAAYGTPHRDEGSSDFQTTDRTVLW